MWHYTVCLFGKLQANSINCYKLFIYQLHILLNCHRHRRRPRRWGRYIKNQASIEHGFMCGGAKSSNTGVILLKIREILIKGLDAGRAKKGDHIVKNFGQIGQVAAHCAEQYCGCKIVPIIQQELLRFFGGYI